MGLFQIAERNHNLADKIVRPNSDIMYAGIVSGNNVGVVWADDVFCPVFCIIWSEHLKGFHFMGRDYKHVNKEDLKKFIDSTLIPFLRNINLRDFEFSCDSPELIPFVCDIFLDFDLKRYKQYVYKLEKVKDINNEIVAPVGYEVYNINEDFIYNKLKNIKNPEVVQSDIDENWGSVSNFIKHGKGFIAAKDNMICSLVMTRFLYNGTHCIGTETFASHKNKGLASALAVSIFNGIVKDGGSIWWDCSADNIASQKTACKAGLVFSHEYEVFWFKL